ncbi:MAG: thermonuclease family protein [Alphaproteobacteria bacterium]|nr:thermonuclease family protein [Alphaproteobacteria bacterium]MBQ8678125.1 thermonuclease family protein [Alphaproteobacteria bacterium]
MSFFKKLFLGSIALSFILIGGSGTQSSNMLLQGGGFIGLIIGLVALYLFTKMAWKAMGCLPSFIVIMSIVCFIIYAIGGFNNGLGGVIQNLKTFVNGQNTLATPQLKAPEPKQSSTPKLSENFTEETQQEQTIPQTQGQKDNGGFMGLLNSITGGNNQPSQPSYDSLPSFTSQVSVITADTLNVQGYKVKLYGIAAPDLTQTCANKTGASYNCGQQAALWLSSWLTTNPVTCRVMKEFGNGNMVAVCSLGQYDLGAALVNAGWAVADPKEGEIYRPYEDNARQKRNGLWQGKFYKPWDWKAIQKRKPQYKVKIIQDNPNRKSFFKF